MFKKNADLVEGGTPYSICSDINYSYDLVLDFFVYLGQYVNVDSNMTMIRILTKSSYDVKVLFLSLKFINFFEALERRPPYGASEDHNTHPWHPLHSLCSLSTAGAPPQCPPFTRLMTKQKNSTFCQWPSWLDTPATHQPDLHSRLLLLQPLLELQETSGTTL